MTMGAEKSGRLRLRASILNGFLSSGAGTGSRPSVCETAPCKRSVLGSPLRGHAQGEQASEPERTAGSGAGKEIPDRLSLYQGSGCACFLTADVKGGSEDKRFYKKLIAKAETIV